MSDPLQTAYVDAAFETAMRIHEGLSLVSDQVRFGALLVAAGIEIGNVEEPYRTAQLDAFVQRLREFVACADQPNRLHS